VVNISFTANAIANDPVISVAPANSFFLQIGSISKTLIPRPSYNSAGDPLRNGNNFQINLRIGESISIEDGVFQAAVSNGVNGGDISFLSQLVQLVDQDILQVNQDDTTPGMTSAQILSYTAP
jgi:hypothetical protein